MELRRSLPAAVRPSPLFVGSAALGAMALLGALALALGAPLLFPAIGASAWVVFRDPAAAPAAPRNVVLSHALAGAIGWLALWASAGLEAHGSLSASPGAAFVVSGALALGVTVFALASLDLVHPPAAATTMIVGMGLLPELAHLAAIVASAALLALFAGVVLRAAGIPYPLWRAPRS